MTWGRIDDHLDDDERFWSIRMESIGLYWAALPRCLRRNENYVSEAHIRTLCSRMNESGTPHELVAAGLWDAIDEADGGGYSYAAKDWTAMTMSEAKRLELAEKRAEAGRRGGLASSKRRATAYQPPSKGEANGSKPNPVPVPVPVPVPRDISLAKASSSSGDDALAFVELWNRHCSPLPILRKPPTGAPAEALLRRIADYFDGDADALGAAIERCAADPHYRQQRYGWVAFARHLDRWGDPGGMGSLDAVDYEQAVELQKFLDADPERKLEAAR